MKIVYDANNSLDAHVVKNLLETEGIEAFVQGEHLQGGVGELAAINLVKVGVNDNDAIRAREIIKAWESKAITADQEPYASSSEKKRSQSSAILIFIFGFTLGVSLTYINFTSPVSHEGIDFNRDGQNDESYTYEKGRFAKFEADTNLDGKVDYIIEYDRRGLSESGRQDADFNGNFEAVISFERNLYSFVKEDLNEDGKVDVVEEYENGDLRTKTFFDLTTGLPRKKLYYEYGRLLSADVDPDGNGTADFEVTYDAYEEEIKRTPIRK